MTEGLGSSRTVVKLMKGIGISRSHTTKNGANAFYYYINDLHRFKESQVEFQAIEEVNKVRPKGL
jgi:hypothetical protein